MIAPDPGLAPLTPPVIVPMIQVKLLGTLAVRLILGLVPLQVDVVAELVIVGAGLTVTVIVKDAPAQVPVIETGVTMYSTDPGVLALGLFRIWLMTEPDPALAPVMPPATVPMVQLKLLETLEVKVIFGLTPLQAVTVPGFVTIGAGYTVTVIVNGMPTHELAFDVGVTV